MIELNFPNPIDDEVDFYGRKAELERVEAVFLSDRRVPVVILGERRIGKTSLQNVAFGRLERARPGRFVRLIVEPRGITSLDELGRAILQRLCTYLKKDLRQTRLLDRQGHFHLETVSQFEAAFAALLEPGSSETFLLCLDEFDDIVRRASDLDAVLGLVRHLVETSRLPLRLFFTMTRLAEPVQGDTSSPLSTQAEIVRLRVFTVAEMERMVLGILRGEVVLPENGLAWLFRLSGGHPYFTKLLLAVLVERQRPGDTALKATPGMLDQALQDAVNDPRAEHAVVNIYRAHFTDPEKRVVLSLARRRGPLSVEELKRMGDAYLAAARKLSERDYLTESEAGYDFRIEFLQHWLRHWPEYEEEQERLNEPV